MSEAEAMADPLNWLWAPALDPAGAAGALLLVAALACAVVASLWPVRVPGEETEAERRQLTTRGGAAVGWGRLALVVGLPAGLVAGAALLVFPLAPPRTVLLSSRARSAEEGGGAWLAQWDGLLESAPPGPSCLDAGGLVDPVCRRALEEEDVAAGAWRLEDGGHRRRLAGVVREVLLDAGQPAAGEEASHRVQAGLPRRVVESLELSVLKGLAQRHNVEKVLALVADRPTRLGRAWDLAETYLAAGSPRHRPTEVVLRRHPEAGEARVERVLAVRREGPGRLVLACLVSVQPAAGRAAGGQKRSVELGLELRQGSYPGRARLEVTAGPQRLVLTREVAFAAVPEGAAVGAVVQHGRQPRRVPVRGALGGGGGAGFDGKVRLEVRSPDDWLATWKALREHGAFADWRERLDEVRLGGEARLELGTAAGSVVIDDRATPGGVWVYPAGLDTSRLGELVGPGEAVPRPLRAARAALADLPGAFSWDSLPLEEQPTHRPRAGAGVVARRGPIARELIAGPIRRVGALPQPLVLRFVEEAQQQQQQGKPAVLTFFSVDPAAQGALLLPGGRPGPRHEPERLAAFWAGVVDAVSRAAGQGRPAGAEEEEEDDAPLPLLDAGDLQLLRAEGVALTLVPLLGALLAFALLVCRAVAAAPRGGEGKS